MCSSTSRRSRLRASAVSPRAIRSNSKSPRVRRACRRKTSARSEQHRWEAQRARVCSGPVLVSGLYIGFMRSIRTALVLFAISPASGVTQTPPGPAGHALATPAYRGFTPGISYRAFVERARTLADSDVGRCQTSPRPAQVMECGVVIRGPNDASRFYLNAHFVAGNAAVVAFYDSAGFGDKRGGPLVDRTQKELVRLFGRPRPIGESGWGGGHRPPGPRAHLGRGGAPPAGVHTAL